jgi:hypothetical protein
MISLQLRINIKHNVSNLKMFVATHVFFFTFRAENGLSFSNIVSEMFLEVYTRKDYFAVHCKQVLLNIENIYCRLRSFRAKMKFQVADCI